MRRRLPVTARDVRDGLVGLATTGAALAVAAALVDGLSVSGPVPMVVAAAVVALGDMLSRPVLRLLVGPLGAASAVFLGLLWQVVLLRVALDVVPGVELDSYGAVVATLIIVALVAAVTRWAIGVNDSSYLVGDLVRRGQARRRRRGAAGAGVSRPPGVVVVQIDGLSYPLLELGILSGTLATLARWLRGGSHRATWWWAQVPSTTPASQAGLLYGRNDQIPAFRWWEKDTGRLMVTSRPRDAAVLQDRLSDGTGLLAGGGVCVSTMFTGDAETSLLAVSRAGLRRGLGPGPTYLRFFASPFVFFRALVLTLGEMAKELFQAWQQRIRRIEPRVSRGGAYVLLRGITNAMLRDLNVALVAEQMMHGAPVIFVNFVDYDEIAHHAGMARPEAMDALAGVDRVLSTLERVADAADVEYRFVVLSDHGQSQGATFRQLHGRTLEDVVRDLCGPGVGRTISSTDDAESWGPVNTLLSTVLGRARSPSRRGEPRSSRRESAVFLGPQRPARQDPAEGEVPDLVVAGSGNLGLVWFAARPGRVGLETVHRDLPALVPGLLGHSAIGFVMADSARGPLVVGRGGVHLLATGEVEGRDPLEPFGPRAAGDLLRLAGMEHCPDLLVHSRVEAMSGDVHAFEELVGSHGGLGGWQNRAVLVRPAGWELDPDLLDGQVPGERILVGAVAVHRQLLRWFERCGVRSPAPVAPTVPGAGPEPGAGGSR